MKKGIFKVLLVILITFMFVPTVYAAGEAISVTGGGNYQSGSTVTLTLKVTTSDRVSGGSFQVASSSGYFTITSITAASGFSNMLSGGNVAIVPAGSGNTIGNGGTLAYIKVKVANNAPQNATANITVSNTTLTVNQTSVYPSQAGASLKVVNPPAPELFDESAAIKVATEAVEKAEKELTQANIDAAQALVGNLTETSTKTALQKRLDKAVFDLAVKIEVDKKKDELKCQECPTCATCEPCNEQSNGWLVVVIALLVIAIFEAGYIIYLTKRED